MRPAFPVSPHLAHAAAGLLAVVVGYTSSAAIVFQAAAAAGAGAAEIASWLWALGIGMGLTCIGLSLKYRSPILTAWSTPGAALLAVALPGFTLAEATGAFLLSSALIALIGVSGCFDRLMAHIPKTLGAAMLAGILLRFGLKLFAALPEAPLPTVAMLVLYLLGRRLFPRYVVPLAFILGLALAALQGTLHSDGIALIATVPQITWPSFSLPALIGAGLPLFVVTMASQNLPGLAVLRANGYTTPASPLIGWTGLTGLLLAPFGGYAFNLAAITAAICMSKEADPRPERRYLAAVWAGVFYLLTGIFGATVAALLAALPNALVVAVAGLALLATLGNSLAGALADEREREAALIAFLVTASGLTLFGIGSAFWGLLLGMAASRILRAA